MDNLLKPYRDRKLKSTVDKFPLDIQACFQRALEQRSSWEQQMAYLIERQFEEEGAAPLQSMNKEDKQRYEALQKELVQFDHLKPQPLPPLMAVADFRGRISPTVIPDDPEQLCVEPAFLTVLSGDSAEAIPALPVIAGSSGRRTALASWIGRSDNPLTTRVIVNRIWQQHFGQGIVPTANDFGHLGQAPTHPELLDWLTVTFVEDGWSLKQLHKLILMSAAWRQSAHHPRAAAHQQQDPAESLLWRARVRRLSAEQIRDAMLLMSGELQHNVGGPSVDVKTPRRSLYVKSFRNTPDEFLHAFDVANGLKSVAERNRTTTPTQALLMINGDYALALAKKWALRLQQREWETPRDLIDYAVRCVWGRRPTPAEMEKSLAFVGLSANPPTTAIDGEKLVDFCHVLLNSNEFLYVD
jgi:hypothetical protein